MRAGLAVVAVAEAVLVSATQSRTVVLDADTVDATGV
jgi:hypothetical protein